MAESPSVGPAPVVVADTADAARAAGVGAAAVGGESDVGAAVGPEEGGIVRRRPAQPLAVPPPPRTPRRRC